MNQALCTKRIIPLILSLAVIFSTPLWGAEEGSDGAGEGGVFEAEPAVRRVTLIGYTRARHVMDIVSEEEGRCVKVEADVGDTIGRAGSFCVLDSTFIDLALEKNRVDQKRLENLIAYQLKEVTRFEKLVGRESAAQSTLDSLQNKLDQHEFELQALKTEEARLRERRERHVIRVPSGWTVVERAVEPGEWISAGTHLGRAGDYRKLLVPFSLSPEEYSTLRRLAGSAKLYFPDEGESGVTMEAAVERISPAFDPETRKISVDLAVGLGLSEMRGGLRAELELALNDPSGAVFVPRSAVLERYDEFWMLRENGEEVQVVLLGNDSEDRARVRSPEVKAGQRFKVQVEP